MNILITGGTGYIGSHTAVTLLQAGHDVIIVDNLSNSHSTVADEVSRLGKGNVRFYQVDIRDRECLDHVFAENEVDAVVHFAGCKAVGESVERPVKYYSNNVEGTVSLLEIMGRHEVGTIVFSSSCTVYGSPDEVPVTEDSPIAPTNPYGRSKRMVEEIMEDLAQAEPGWRISLLRYFNPAGAHPSGRIGENPLGKPDNLMPYIAQVAAGKREQLQVFGNDYHTRDGTGVRDYIHVMDLAEGHLKALEYIADRPGVHVHNLGTGRGHSVLELVHTFEEVTGREVPYEITGRRPGDVAEIYAAPAKAERELGWRATRTLEDMCRDMWRYSGRDRMFRIGKVKKDGFTG